MTISTPASENTTPKDGNVMTNNDDPHTLLYSTTLLQAILVFPYGRGDGSGPPIYGMEYKMGDEVIPVCSSSLRLPCTVPIKTRWRSKANSIETQQTLANREFYL